MFLELQNQVWTVSDPSVVVTNNTDTSIDGSCKKCVWTNGYNKSVTISFTAIDLSDYEELSIYFLYQDVLYTGTLFKVVVDGVTFNFTRENLKAGRWEQVLIDCSTMGTVTTIVITSLIPDLVLMVDYPLVRLVNHESDVDIIRALKSHISLSYGVSTTLSASAPVGSTQLSLVSFNYINQTSILQLDDGAGITEQVELVSDNGLLREALVNPFSAGDEVTVLCPVRGEDYDSVEPDPVCGVVVYDMGVDKQDTVVKTRDKRKTKQFLGPLGVAIYIDCSSKKKLLQLAREFNLKYGERFQFLLDGEQVDVMLDSSVFVDDEIGNNPRMTYLYRIEPQPYTVVVPVAIDTLTITGSPVTP